MQIRHTEAKEWNEFKADFPEIAKAIDVRFAAERHRGWIIARPIIIMVLSSAIGYAIGVTLRLG